MSPDERGAPEHPSPYRRRISTAWLLSGLAIPPAAWTLQLLVGYGIASNACTLTQGHVGQRQVTGFADEGVLLIAIQIGFLVSAIGSGLMSWRHWSALREEKTDSEHSHLTLGEGRARFLAMCGMFMASVFSVAIAFNLLEPIMIPHCWSFR